MTSVNLLVVNNFPPKILTYHLHCVLSDFGLHLWAVPHDNVYMVFCYCVYYLFHLLFYQIYFYYSFFSSNNNSIRLRKLLPH